MSTAQQSGDELMRRLMMERTPCDRLQMCSRMFSTARTLAIAGIAAEGDDLDEATLRQRIFLRFYGTEFSERERSVIATRMKQHNRQS